MPKEGQLTAERALIEFADRNGLSIPEVIGDPRGPLPEISVRKGVLGYLTKLKNAAGQQGAVETAVVGASDAKPDLFQRVLKWSPAGAIPLVATVGIAAGGTAEANDDYLPLPTPEPVVTSPLPDGPAAPQDGQPTPNPNYIPNEEEPNPVGPPVVPDDGNPDNDPPLPVPTIEPHEEFYQLIVKKAFDGNQNDIFEWGVDSPLDQQFRYWEDLNRNGQPDAGEGLQSNLRTGPDGVEVITDSVFGNVEGLPVCVEETNIDPNLEPVTPTVQCSVVDAASNIVEVRFLNRNREVIPPSPTPVVPTPTPTPVQPTPQPTRPPVPTPTPTGPEQPPVVVIPPVVQSPAPQPEVCPEGQALPDVFQGPDVPPYGAQLEEIKCEIIEHDEFLHEHDDRMTQQHEEQNRMNTEQHGEILDAVEEHDKESSKEHRSIIERLDRIWDGVKNGGHDIWDRIDVGASVVAGAGVLILGAGLMEARRRLRNRFNRIDDNLAQIRARLDQQPPQPPIQPEPEPQPEPTPEPTPEPEPTPQPEPEPQPEPTPQPEPRGRLTNEQVQLVAQVLEIFDRIFNTVDELTDAQINRRLAAARMTEEQVNAFRLSMVQAILAISDEDREEELKTFSLTRLIRRFSARARRLDGADALRIAQAREQLRAAQ